MISIVFALIIIGIALYVVNEVIPMDARIKKLLNIVAIAAVCFWLFGALHVRRLMHLH